MKRSHLIYRITLLVSLLCACGSAQAQLEFSISPTPVGSGARAAGMADAFVAVADDATAASWNPAGLVQLERPEFSIVGDFNSLADFFRDSPANNNEATHRTAATNLNFMSFTYPLPRLILSRNAVLSLTYQQRYDFTRDFNIAVSSPTIPGAVRNFDYNFDQEGSLSAISPAFAIELNHRLSVGVAMNLWRSSFISQNDWQQTVTIDTLTTNAGVPTGTTHRVTTEEYDDFRGENVTAGVLWNVTPKWNLALRYDSAFEGDVKYKSTLASTVTIPPIKITKENRSMKLPETWAIGISYRHSDKLTLAAQLSRTDWDDFYIQKADGTRVSLVDGTDLGNPVTKTDYNPTHSVRLGLEYLLIPDQPDVDMKYLWSLRGGLIYDEEPASGRSTFKQNSKGDGKPDQFYGFALGAGLQAFQRVNFDISYQLRSGHSVKSDRLRGLDGFEEDLLQQRILFSTIIFF